MAPAATVLLKEDSTNAASGALGLAKDGRKLKIRSCPQFNTPLEERIYRKQHLAAAFRIFADKGYDEGIAGHISVRDPILTDHFWLNPLSAHFSQIKVSDLILVYEEGQVVEGDEPINGAAFAIHSEIHKARPEVNAACHAHSVHGKAFSAFGRELDMIAQDALRFYKSHAVYTEFGGVVLDREEGKRIAKALGNGKAVILQNHGLLTVGGTVDEAAFWFISLDETCHAQLLVDAAEFGSGYKRKIINEEEAEFTAKQVGGPEKGWLAFQPYNRPVKRRGNAIANAMAAEDDPPANTQTTAMTESINISPLIGIHAIQNMPPAIFTPEDGNSASSPHASILYSEIEDVLEPKII